MADKTLPRVDAVIVGFGWCGAILAKELTEAGLNVVALERGPARDTWPDGAYPGSLDELTHNARHALFQNLATSTVTLRHHAGQPSAAYRRLSAFLPGTGTGGAGLHWSGCHWRITPAELRIRSTYEERYGRGFVPDDLTLQDWGVGYEELEPYFDFAEKVFGTSGQAYKVGGQVVGPGNPFDADRSAPFPLPPMKNVYSADLFGRAAAEVGYHPFSIPSANASAAYTNPYGCQMGACTFCGYCSGYACYNDSKASPNVNILPALRLDPKFELRSGCDVVRIETDSDRRRATGVVYADPDGNRVTQPADLVILATFAYNNAWLLLLSGIGKPYDPVSGTGVVGRNFCYQNENDVTLFFDTDRWLNPFIGAGGNGVAIDDFNSDHFDHGPLGFVGGAPIWVNQSGNKPLGNNPVPDGTPKWGSAWKRSVRDSFAHSMAINAHGTSMPNRANFLDLDPDYTDHLGRKLLRITFDWHENDFRMAEYTVGRMLVAARAIGPKSMHVSLKKRGSHFDARVYQTTHMGGGAIMGTDPTTSVVNRYLQSWDVSNLFVIGSSAFPQGLGYNPTGAVAALAYWSARAIRTQYLKSPGPLVPL